MKPPIRIELPIPPTTNRLFPTVRGRRICSEEYKAWKQEAGWSVLQAKVAPYAVPVALTLTIRGGKGFTTRRDLTNCWKSVEDLLVAHGLIPDDNVNWIPEHHDRYEKPTDKTQPARCWVEITEADSLTEGDTH